jgi:FkbM family methyltransferase
MRTPSPIESLEVFKSCFKGNLDAVVDIGVQAKTQFLIEVFPVATHYLFEPVSIYHPMIRANYEAAGISYELIGSAVADVPGNMYLHLLSSDASGRVTHSQLLSSRDPARFGPRLHSVEEIDVITMDSWLAQRSIGAHYAVKIDVDGIEDQIITGGRRLLAGAAIVVVEAQLENIARRIFALQELGLRLFDIVGNGYYFDQLQQVDLVFVSGAIISADIDFQPWKKHGKVIWEHWQQFN